MSYSIIVNSVLLDKALDSPEYESLLTAIALTSAVGTCLVGIVGNAPVGGVVGLRLNAYFTFGFSQRFGISFAEALSCSFVSGVLLMLFACLGVGEWISREVISDHLKKAIAVSMGIFQALIGLQLMGYSLMQQHELVTITCPKMNRFEIEPKADTTSCSNTGAVLVACAFCLMACLLSSTRVNGTVLTGIATVAVGSWITGLTLWPRRIFSAPRFDTFFMIDFAGWFRLDKLGTMVTGSVVMTLVNLFDVTGVQYGLYSIAGLLKNGGVPHSVGIICSAGIATMVGAIFGTSPVVIANESSAGIMEGARTGLSAVVAAAFFGLAAFITPLLNSIPDLAAVAPLVVIGAFMMEPSRSIDWTNLRVAIPSFVTILLVPNWIHDGMFVGVVFDTVLGAATRLTSAVQGIRCLRSCCPCTRDEAAEHSMALSREKNLPVTPHGIVSTTMGLKDAEKLERARQLLHDLGPPCTGMRASETWEMALRHALQLYIDGMSKKPVRETRA